MGNDKQLENRISKIKASFALLECFLKGNVGQYKTNAPKDLEIAWMEPCFNKTFYIYVKSESFEIVNNRDEIPEIEIIFTKEKE